MAEAEHHARIDVVGRADAFAERKRRLVDHLAHDPCEHTGRNGLHALRCATQVPEGPLARLAGDLDQGERHDRVERLAVHGSAEPFHDDLRAALAGG